MKFISLIKTFLFLSAGLFVNVVSSCANLHVKATNSSGIITSGLYPANYYSANMDCRWNLSSNAKMELVFLHFKLDPSADYVNVYDGKSSASPLIGTFTASSLPTPITSSSNELYVTFTTDGSGENQGFAATYRGKSVSHEISHEYTIPKMFFIVLRLIGEKVQSNVPQSSCYSNKILNQPGTLNQISKLGNQ